ncbi:RNA 3'-terminal phosphate cyclase-like protein [Galdieria sulphuraria]|uniref:RNA 3'-terminal phosphate cyclase-like protein n=1 Tax=Galdieria sulphuraria TaxID=130081 RepID=M2X054_GALSU|nr:RNA 3'-terminal phosphate cyclase-like protein [Galdieria sulphuraria]EME29710.1 RNA 3'-terminal phosphate cyclase-like protein [Galdieria sulphuraria]GJD08001.1 RNA 3'-terminal phosphate cyclase-like protein [Galdieria sulphuraria]|eukprot:XP_005706230.1 RNA 3'-terminal phosphate cyclase-like protein [Galdieria sulphuraria]
MAIRVHRRVNFRYRLLLALFTGKQIVFDFSEEPNHSQLLKPNEISLLRLLDRITSGTQLQLDEAQCLVTIQPGVLIGGNVTHQCSTCRGLTYYLEFLALLAPYCKRTLEATLTGVTAHPLDTSVDTFQNVTIPLLRKLGLGKECSLKIKKRDSSAYGLGEVLFTCPIILKALEPIEWKNREEIKRIRGMAYCSRIPPNVASQLIDNSRNILCEYLTDVFIYSDWNPGGTDEPSISLSLFAETSSGFILGADSCWKGKDWNEEILSSVSQEATQAILFQAMENSVVDTQHQLFICLWMALSSADLSTVELGRLTPCTIQLLRDIQDFMGVAFQIERGSNNNHPSLLCSCIGMEYRNENRRRY